MRLAGQGDPRRSERGYAMAALLVAMSITAVMMTVAMPVWKHQAQREREEELVFRGQQYVHAIGLFQRKYANAYPPNVDVLVEQRFLRKKFKDPITGDDFALLPRAPAPPRRGSRRIRAARPRQPARIPGPGNDGSRQPSQQPPQAGGGGQRRAGGAGAPRAERAAREALAPARCAACRRLARPARAAERRLASAAWRARARINRFASITVALITTSGRSSTSRRCRQPGQGGAPGTAQPGQVPQPPAAAGSDAERPSESRQVVRAAAAAPTPFDMPGRGGRGPGQQTPSSRRTLGRAPS